MTANNLRKTSKEKEVVTMAKSLIKTWKKCQRKTLKRRVKRALNAKFNSLSKSLPSKMNIATTDDVRLQCHEMLTLKYVRSGLPDGICNSPEDSQIFSTSNPLLPSARIKFDHMFLICRI
uniref:Transcription elongation factor SIIlike [Metaseiulus occidentalis] n=1 Tax=Lepeophtheirus salmonis TaxID=72036 RepID=A0A0K2U7T0_LEPSM